MCVLFHRRNFQYIKKQGCHTSKTVIKKILNVKQNAKEKMRESIV